MWSPNPKVWSPEIQNVESKILRSRSVMMTIGASPMFRSEGHGRRHYILVTGGDIVPSLIRSGRDNGGQENSIYPTFPIHKLGFSHLVHMFVKVKVADDEASKPLTSRPGRAILRNRLPVGGGCVYVLQLCFFVFFCFFCFVFVFFHPPKL